MSEPGKKVIIVGGGPGGLTSAMLLAHRGFEVTVYEKRDRPGGRSGQITRGDYTFDIGSTLVMMRFVLDEMFELTGRRSEDFLEFVQLDPMYKLDFAGRSITISNDHERTKSEIQRVFPGNEGGLQKMLVRERQRFQALYDVLQGSYPSLVQLMDRRVVRGLFHFALGRSMFDVMGDYFSDDELKLAFTFQAQYLGMSPWNCPGGFSIVPFVEHGYGIEYVMGGIGRITQAMAQVVEEEGGRIVTGAAVRRLVTRGWRVAGVELEDGTVDEADAVVLNADFAYAMTELVQDGLLRKYTPRRVAQKKLSSSTFMLYLGLDTCYDAPHHRFVFADDPRRNMDDVFAGRELSGDMSVYMCNPSVTDPSLAPPGHSSLYMLVPVPNLNAPIDWAEAKESYRDRVLEFIATRTDMTDIADHIREEIIVTPEDWKRELNVYRGAVFSLSHHLNQLLFFRPHNDFEELAGCYLVGGGTNPGSGMPTIWESGRISADLISRKEGLAPPRPKPLPL